VAKASRAYLGKLSFYAMLHRHHSQFFIRTSIQEH